MQDNTDSRLELNAHLMKLTEGWDVDSANSIVQAFQHLPIASNKGVRTIETKHRASTGGQTDEVWDINISGDYDVKETVTGENEGERERVGYFEVRRSGLGDGNFSAIEYWEADASTRSFGKAPNPIYRIEYLIETLEPYALLVWEWAEKSLRILDNIRIILHEPTLLFWYMLKPFGMFHIERHSWTASLVALHGESQL